MESIDMHERFQTELGSGHPVPKFSFSPCFCSVMDSDLGLCYFCHFTVPFPFWRDKEISPSLTLTYPHGMRETNLMPQNHDFAR